jgi:tetratricopeptide (TPR) repeat protein
MNLIFRRLFMLSGLGVWLMAGTAFAADTNPQPAAITHDDLTRNYLQIQEQIHATQLILQESQVAAAEAARTNVNALTTRIHELEQAIADQRSADAKAASKTQHLTLLLAGVFGLAGLGIMLLMVYFQWRAFTQLAQISSQNHTAIASNAAVHQLAAPGRVTVETSNNRLLDVVGQLEKRIHELEHGQKMLPETSAEKFAGPLAGAQKFLDANQMTAALDLLDKFLAAHPNHAEALVKKAVALEKLGRTEEALANCDRAIAADGTFAEAHLQKGGLLNRLRRYDEALNCFEQALAAKEKKATAKSQAA